MRWALAQLDHSKGAKLSGFCLFSVLTELFLVFSIILSVIPFARSPLYLVLSVLSFVSLCGHRTPVFCSIFRFYPFPLSVSAPHTIYGLPVLCPRCSPLFLFIPQCVFSFSEFQFLVASPSYPGLCIYLPHFSYPRF